MFFFHQELATHVAGSVHFHHGAGSGYGVPNEAELQCVVDVAATSGSGSCVIVAAAGTSKLNATMRILGNEKVPNCCWV